MNILVIGDSCKDVFNYGIVTRLAPEAPVPVFNTEYSIENYGMAGNVFRNIQSLINKNKLDIKVDLKSNPNWENIKKIRYVEDKSNHMFLRVDENDNNYFRLDIRTINFKKYDAIVISDYNKGCLKSEDIEYITKNHNLTIIDTKKKIGSWIDSATFIKVNTLEYHQNKEYIDTYLKDKTIITLGSQGCKFQDKIWSVPKVEVKDVAGAGDSFLAGFSVNYLLTKDINFTITEANNCSTLVVQKRGVSVV